MSSRTSEAAAPTSTIPARSPLITPKGFTEVWRDDNCFTSDVTRIFELSLLAIGFCRDPHGEHAVAWHSETGFDWPRVLEVGPNINFSDVSTNGGTAGALITGSAGVNADKPIVWSGRVGESFQRVALPTSGDEDWAQVSAVAWDGDRFLAVGTAGVPGTFESNAVAWLDSGEGAGWTRIDVPPRATAFYAISRMRVPAFRNSS